MVGRDQSERLVAINRNRWDPPGAGLMGSTSRPRFRVGLLVTIGSTPERGKSWHKMQYLLEMELVAGSVFGANEFHQLNSPKRPTPERGYRCHCSAILS